MRTPRQALIATFLLAVGAGFPAGCSEHPGTTRAGAQMPRRLVVGVDMDALARRIRPDARRAEGGLGPELAVDMSFYRVWGVAVDYQYDCAHHSCRKQFQLIAGVHESTATLERLLRIRLGYVFPRSLKEGQPTRLQNACYVWKQNALVMLGLWNADADELERECDDLVAALGADGVVKYGTRFPDRPVLQVRRKVAEAGGTFVVDYRVDAPAGSYILPPKDSPPFYTDIPPPWHRVWYPWRRENPVALSIGAPNGLIWSWLPDEIPGDHVLHISDRGDLDELDRRDELRREGLLPTEQEKWALVDKLVFHELVVPETARRHADEDDKALDQLRRWCPSTRCPEMGPIFELLALRAANRSVREHAIGLIRGFGRPRILAVCRLVLADPRFSRDAKGNARRLLIDFAEEWDLGLIEHSLEPRGVACSGYGADFERVRLAKEAKQRKLARREASR